MTKNQDLGNFWKHSVEIWDFFSATQILREINIWDFTFQNLKKIGILVLFEPLRLDFDAFLLFLKTEIC